MADRITITNARNAFAQWVAAVGGQTTEEARLAGNSLIGTFHLEEWRLGDGRTTVRVAEVVNEGLATRDPLGYIRLTPRDFVNAVRIALSTLDAREKIRSKTADPSLD